MKARIRLVVDRPNGLSSDVEIECSRVTPEMLDAAEDLLHTITTGERPVIKNLYDLVAHAFGTTREVAKDRLTAAAYSMSPEKIEQRWPREKTAEAFLGLAYGRPRLTALDQRRLADGERALALPKPQSLDEIRTQLEVIHDGMLALQSLDDIGEEGNRRAHENFCTLEKRYEVLQARLLAAPTSKKTTKDPASLAGSRPDPNELCTWPLDGRQPGPHARACNRTDCPYCRPEGNT